MTWVIISRTMRLAGYIARMAAMMHKQKILVINHEKMRPFHIPTHRCEDNIKMHLN